MRLALIAVLVATSAHAQLAWVDDCGLEPPGAVVRPPVPPKVGEIPFRPGDPPVVRRDALVVQGFGIPSPRLPGQGALTGKTVYLSPGHGFTWSPVDNGWRTQRPTTNSIVEDLVSIETVSQFLMPLLMNAGAQVVPVRELDMNRAMVIVDNGEAGYLESGAAGLFSDSTLTSFGRPTFPMTGDVTPFELGHNRLMNTSPTDTAQASWATTVPSDGLYTVYISYTAFTARVTDAHYVVRHGAGESHFRVNQQHHGKTWVTLGRFYFRAGEPAVIEAHNDSTQTGNVSLDAVRLGGGLGFIDRGGGISGRPSAEQSCRYQAQWAGAPSSVWAPTANTPTDDRNNDVGARSRFTSWLHETGEDALYVAWHTNAFDGTAVGTDVYVYGPNPPDGTYTFTGVAGSDTLAQAIHTELINDIRASAGWNRPTWTDRGVHSAYFGELNPANNSETPSVLLEIAFHDNVSDAAQLKEPMFRYLATRAIAQGIIKYLAARDGVAVHLPPEAPTHAAVTDLGGGQALLRWHAPATDSQGVAGDAAIPYRVYASLDGLAWDDGVDAAGTSLIVQVPGPGARFFRVTALNAGGESFPSSVVGASVPVHGRPFVLVVNGFDRLEAALDQSEDLSSYALGTVLRALLPQMNDAASVRRYGAALDGNVVGFDSASAEAVAAGDVSMAPYTLVVWLTGRGHAGGAGPTAAEQGVITTARAAGVPLLFSGTASSQSAFVASALHGAAVPAAGTASVTGAGPLAGLTLALDDGSSGSYWVGASDVVTPDSQALSLGQYAGGGGAGVGVASQVAYVAFPFEGLVGGPSRTEVMRRLLLFLSPAGLDGGTEPGPDGGPPSLDAGPPETDGGPSSPDGGVLQLDEMATTLPAAPGCGCGAAPQLGSRARC